MIPFLTSHQTLQPAPGLASRLEEIVVSPKNHDIDFGILITDKGGHTLYEHEADSKLMPASNMKILTHVFAYSTLGTSYRPITKFWREADGLVVEAPGDPTIDQDQLIAIKSKFSFSGPYKIKVKGFKGGYPSGWSDDDYQNTYGASIFPLTVNKALIPVYASNGQVEPLPDFTGISLKRGSERGAPGTAYNFWARTLTVSGSMPVERSVVATVPAPDPMNYACGLLGGSLASADKVPDRTPDAVIEGKTMQEMACACLKPSDNMMAEHILELAAQEDVRQSHDIVTSFSDFLKDAFSTASLRLQKFYNRLGVPLKDINTFDGSGLSRNDRVTARTLVTALSYANSQPYASEFAHALPHSGEGTLRSRLKDVDVSAKTGSLHDVASLSGYVYPNSEKTVIFSIIGNTHGRPASAVREVADRIVREIAANDVQHGSARPQSDSNSLPNTGNGLAPGPRIR